MKLSIRITFVFCYLCVWSLTSQVDKTSVLIRSDDFGMSHAVNMALPELIQTGIPFNASVMMPCAWAQEAADLLKEATHVSAGIHLTLTSEFEQMKWGPVAGLNAVPSLVDDRGYFRSSVREFLLSDYDLSEVETELRAQIERALALNMEIDYLDHHMGIARSTPEIAAIVEKLAEEYGLAISRYFNETTADAWGAPIDDKVNVILNKLNNLDQDRINMLVFHTAQNNPELAILNDLNTHLMTDQTSGMSVIAGHRNAELKVFTSKEFSDQLKGKKVITYKDLKNDWLDQMRRNAIIYESIEASKISNQSR
jgi:predicted glycoside hydrolase/deacetylase ChbG (UPF0249 family)